MNVNKILVPLDGTAIAENACFYAADLAAKTGAKIILLHVIEKNAPKEVHGLAHLNSVEGAQNYLQTILAWEEFNGLDLSFHIHTEAGSSVAGDIVAHEEELSPDLIVMTRHGHNNLARMIRGSLPQRVVNLGKTPLLLVPDKLLADISQAFKKLLVPLDGEADHEQAFEFACTFAPTYQSALHLITVVNKPSQLAGGKAPLSRFMPGTTWALQQQTMEKLHSYLEQKIDQAEQVKIPAVAEIVYGKIASSISKAVKKTDAGMILLATHGKAGAEAFWANSISAKVVEKSPLAAILLIPL